MYISYTYLAEKWAKSESDYVASIAKAEGFKNGYQACLLELVKEHPEHEQNEDTEDVQKEEENESDND